MFQAGSVMGVRHTPHSGGGPPTSDGPGAPRRQGSWCPVLPGAPLAGSHSLTSCVLSTCPLVGPQEVCHVARGGAERPSPLPAPLS